MADQSANWIDDIARRSPTALAMALERAITARDQALERAVLVALADMGIVVIDRTALTDAIIASKPRRARGGARA